MRYREIMEANLKLVKGDLARLRGSYAAFIITMSPGDFLKLTACPSDLEYISKHEFPKSAEVYRELRDTDKDFGAFNIPFLSIEWPTGKVVGHEGRHRALMVQRSGGTNFPVAIFMRAQHEYEVHYTKSNLDTYEETQEVEQFGTDYKAARARADELKNWNANERKAWTVDAPDQEPILYRKVKVETLRGGEIKGSPNYNNPDDYWDRRPYAVEDMPKRLISQYDDDISVTNYRVGLVKGYRHFRNPK